jgi:hypothetical protein
VPPKGGSACIITYSFDHALCGCTRADHATGVYCRVRVATTSPCSRTVTRKVRHRKRFHFFCCGTTDKYFAAGGARWTGRSPQPRAPPRRQQQLWSTKTRASPHGAASHVEGARDKVRIEDRTSSRIRCTNREACVGSAATPVAHGS